MCSALTFNLQFFNSSEPTTGAVAQLGEHLLCKQGVVGSIPISSTNLSAELKWPCPSRLSTSTPQNRPRDQR